MPTPYDQVPYPCNAYAQTHPGNLSTIARFHGMTPAPPDLCRVLEIGCGDGGNLLPLAYVLPGSRFLGIDLAVTSIESGIRHARNFGLTNIEFRAADLLQLSKADLGEWDYIVAHGVFSWVPDAVRRRLLGLCRELLSPQGVAFISYNAFPGGHLRQMAREMLLYHVERAPNPETKIAQGRALMHFLASSTGSDDEFGALLRSEAERVLKYDANHFYHDDLAELNQSFYLHQFADLAASHGLQYLGDADYSSMHDLRYPSQVREVLSELGEDVIRKEQYLDFLKCRRFRQTLLCHQEVELRREPSAELLRDLFYASSAKPTSVNAQLTDESIVSFEGEGGLRLTTSHPIAKLALAFLGLHWPARVQFNDIERAITSASGIAPSQGTLENVLREFLQMGTAEAFPLPAPFTTEVSTRPRASAWALYQLQFGGGLTTLRHQTIHIRDDFGRWLLSQLDGTKTGEDIAQNMAVTVKPKPDGAVNLEKELAEARDLVADGLRHLAALGLLLPDADG